MDLTILKASGFKGDLVTPEHPDYESSIIRWSLSCQKRAQVVAYVTDEQDVSLVIKYARENNLDIAIKGGSYLLLGRRRDRSFAVCRHGRGRCRQERGVCWRRCHLGDCRQGHMCERTCYCCGDCESCTYVLLVLK
jgi:hypothetical protein